MDHLYPLNVIIFLQFSDLASLLGDFIGFRWTDRFPCYYIARVLTVVLPSVFVFLSILFDLSNSIFIDIIKDL